MEAAAHIPFLRKSGLVLLAVGIIDIAVMVYCIVNRISYSSSFNIFAVVAGIFLLRGSLRAASVVRWFAVFMLSGFLCLLVAWPFMQPLDLTLTQARLSPLATLGTVTFLLAVLVLLFWLQRTLGQPAVLAARAGEGRPQRNMRIPAAAGLALVVLLVVFLNVLLGGESAAKAIGIAQQQLGPAYKYHVSSLSISKGSEGTWVSGVVTAWNAREVRDLPVEWRD